MIICAGCDRPILDRYLLNVLDRAWHTRCVLCSDCNAPLTEKCFSRDGKLFCKNDFFIRFGTKCAGCTLGISPSDLVRKAKNKVFHLKCFTCLICQKELSTGEELYILDENKFICKDDYIASKLAGSDVDDDVDYDCEKEADTDDLDNKSDLFLQNSEHDHHMNAFSNNNQLNNQFNDSLSTSHSQAMDDTEKFLPPSPIGDNPHHLQENGLSKTNPHGGPLSPGVKNEPMDQLSDTCQSPGGRSQDSSKISNVNPGSNCSSLEANDNNNNKETSGSTEKVGNKRRGPRTTIKAKQLELLKASFNSTPKPTRHIREQLAAETGLNMRVIQVWFQNRRSKERRMKQLSALGARRHFFNRNPRRMRPLQPGELEERELMAGGGYGYFNDNGQDFYPGYMGHGYGGEFFPGQGPDMTPGGMPLLPPHGRASPPMGMENQLPPHPGAHLGPEAQYLHPDMMPRAASPETLTHLDEQYMMSLPPRSLPGQFPPHSAENWS